MEHPETHVVRPGDARPAGRPDECFYCQQPMGEQHTQSCVIRSRTVIVRFTIDVVVDEPVSSDADMINFRYNESSWCASNLTTWLQLRREADCLCEITSAQFLREATAEDEEGWDVARMVAE